MPAGVLGDLCSIAKCNCQDNTIGLLDQVKLNTCTRVAQVYLEQVETELVMVDQGPIG